MAVQDTEIGWCGEPITRTAKRVMIALYRWITGKSITEEEVLISQMKKLANDNWV